MKNLKTILFIAILSLYSGSFFAQTDKRHLSSKPVAELQKLADNNDAEAQYWLSIRYRYNYESGDVIIDEEKGLYWLQIATDNNNNLAMQETLKINLGSFIPVQKNEAEKIFAWSKEKFESSNAEDQKEVADIFYMKELYDKAMYWYQKGADKDFASSQYELSKMYGLGIGTKADKKLAKYWKKRANSLDGTHYDLAKVEEKHMKEAEKEENERFEARMQNLYKNENIIKNESFVKKIIPELQKTEQAVNQKIKDNDAAFRGTTVEAEKEKAQREAAFREITERNASNSNASNSSNDSNSSSSNGINTNKNNMETDSSNSSSGNSSTSNSSSSNSYSGTAATNVSIGSNSSTGNSSNRTNSGATTKIVLTDTTDYKYIAKQKEDAEKQKAADLQSAKEILEYQRKSDEEREQKNAKIRAEIAKGTAEREAWEKENPGKSMASPR